MLARVAGLNEPVMVRLSDRPEDTIHGTLVGLDPNGYALVDTGEAKPRVISAGDVLLGSSDTTGSAG